MKKQIVLTREFKRTPTLCIVNIEATSKSVLFMSEDTLEYELAKAAATGYSAPTAKPIVSMVFASSEGEGGESPSAQKKRCTHAKSMTLIVTERERKRERERENVCV